MATYCVMVLLPKMAVLPSAASLRVVVTTTSRLKTPTIVQMQEQCAVTVVIRVRLEVSKIRKSALFEFFFKID